MGRMRDALSAYNETPAQPHFTEWGQLGETLGGGDSPGADGKVWFCCRPSLGIGEEYRQANTKNNPFCASVPAHQYVPVRKIYFSMGGAVVIFTQYPDMMTIADLRSALGIGRTKAYELVSSGELCSFRVGKTIRIPKASVLDYIVEKSYNMGETGRRSYHEGGNSS